MLELKNTFFNCTEHPHLLFKPPLGHFGSLYARGATLTLEFWAQKSPIFDLETASIFFQLKFFLEKSARIKKIFFENVQNYRYVAEYTLFRSIGPIPGSVFKFEPIVFSSPRFQVQAPVGLQAPLQLITPSS